MLAVLTGMAEFADAAWRPGGVWGLGTQRSLAGLQAHCGVGFAQRAVLPRGLWGGLAQQDFLD